MATDKKIHFFHPAAQSPISSLFTLLTSRVYNTCMACPVDLYLAATFAFVRSFPLFLPFQVWNFGRKSPSCMKLCELIYARLRVGFGGAVESLLRSEKGAKQARKKRQKSVSSFVSISSRFECQFCTSPSKYRGKAAFSLWVWISRPCRVSRLDRWKNPGRDLGDRILVLS